ncbi:aminotransferase class V-fold PLP-dependent enzyme [Oxyplasma meridianum]|uniref:cysteine desulfurase n=1 Tax=Oxyplasma meridianum TaxID=3073602 RepID=A0AAX4NFI7_9ARCH
MVQWERIKQDFPIFLSERNRNLTYLDSAATSQKPKSVIDAVTDFYQNYCSNVHRGIYSLSETATDMYEKSRENISGFIGSPSSDEIVFLRNTTEALNLLSYTLGRNLSAGDEVLISIMEHHSNIVPWQFLEEKGIKVIYTDITKEGKLDMEDFRRKITPRTKIVSITHVSNLLGTINPVREIGKMAHDNGSIFIVDGAQSVPHMKVNVQDIGCDFFAFSGHKMLGPSGIGVLYGKREMLHQMHPFLGGGEMIRTVSTFGSTWNDVPLKFEAGTPNIEGSIGLSAAVDYLNRVGMDEIRDHERDLIQYTLKMEDEYDIENLVSYGPRDPNAKDGVYSFNIGEIPPMDMDSQLMNNGLIIGSSVHPHDVSSSLDETDVAVRSGHHCAMPLNHRLGVVATSRASYYVYNTRNDVDRLFEQLERIRKVYNHGR